MANTRHTTRFDLTGKSALVVGASGTFGRAGAFALGEAGCSVTVADLDNAKTNAVASDLAAADIPASAVALWPDSEANAEAMVQAAVDAHGRLDVVFIALGTNDVGFVEDQSENGWRKVMDANLDCYWRTCQAAGRQFARQPAGEDRYKITVASSTRGKLGHSSGYAAYCASKAGLDGMVRALSGEWGTKNININAIGPTVFRSPVSEWMFDEEGPGKAVRENMLERIPIGRLGDVDDLMGGLIYLSAPASDFMTGQTIYIDGGYTAI
ncbi:MAG: NAD(P)-dependent dehydrogenase (short-subunit alcohol dehydrogenase family) [Paracoccaceae bacterium]|jgi:NAD(P)-dependent dehydrogenase (short-subunit alcohol dehydrogenase family)